MTATAEQAGALGTLEHDALFYANDDEYVSGVLGFVRDGLEFEVSWLVPAQLITDDLTMRTAPLDLEAEIARYGVDTRGGVGVSTPSLR